MQSIKIVKNKIINLPRRLYHLSLKTVVNYLFFSQTSKHEKPHSNENLTKKEKIFRPITTDFLNSNDYLELMSKHLPYNKFYDIHEAQNKTMNFCFRHFEANHILGVFRWRGIQEHLHILLTG